MNATPNIPTPRTPGTPGCSGSPAPLGRVAYWIGTVLIWPYCVIRHPLNATAPIRFALAVRREQGAKLRETFASLRHSGTIRDRLGVEDWRITLVTINALRALHDLDIHHHYALIRRAAELAAQGETTDAITERVGRYADQIARARPRPRNRPRKLTTND